MATGPGSRETQSAAPRGRAPRGRYIFPSSCLAITMSCMLVVPS
jgi:hypothetical protein